MSSQSNDTFGYRMALLACVALSVGALALLLVAWNAASRARGAGAVALVPD